MQEEHIIDLYKKEVTSHKLLTAAEEHELLVKCASGDRSARDRLVLANLRMVMHYSTPFQNRGIPFMDLQQVGTIGLITAIDKFKAGTGRLSTYAKWWIEQAFMRELQNNARNVRLPVHLHERLGKVYRAQIKLSCQSEMVSSSDIAEETGMPLAEVDDILILMSMESSLDFEIGLNVTLGDITLGNRGPTEERLDDYRQLHELKAHVDSLTGKLREIIVRRFGLDEEKPEKLEELAARMGVSRQRIQQLERQGLNKLQKMFHKKELRANHRRYQGGHTCVGTNL